LPSSISLEISQISQSVSRAWREAAAQASAHESIQSLARSVEKAEEPADMPADKPAKKLADEPAEKPAGDPAAKIGEVFDKSGVRIFSKEELSKYDGIEKGVPIYLAIIGDVFDVSTGAKFYKKGRSYHHFAGRDGSRSFVTGESSGEGLSDNIDGLDDEELDGIAHWHGFFTTHETYKKVGRVSGAFYSEQGVTKREFPWARLRAKEEASEALKVQFPGCNSKWTQADGSTVWCTTKSGGIQRDWVGVPRLMQREGVPQRCVCVPPERADSVEFEHYAGCPLDSERCTVPKKA